MSRYKILCLGNQWKGSDDGSIFNAFSRQGHLIEIIDHKFYLPSEKRSNFSKAITKLISAVYLKDYNNAILSSIELFKPDTICVYKGNCVLPETLMFAKKKGISIFCIYPDVSFYDHDSNIPKLVPLYDYIFTTKSFGVKDLKEQFNFTNVSLINHCIDPNIHRNLNLSNTEFSHLSNDVSFIGSYSLKKQGIISKIIQNNPNLDIKIWGGSWNLCKDQKVSAKYMNTPVFGDLYAIAIQKSKINLGILSEAGKKSSLGDQVTSRTFHIPGAGGFMIHEYTEEVLEIFEEGVSVVTFKNEQELSDKIQYYLSHDFERDKIRKAGYDVVWRYHKSDERVNFIIKVLENKGVL